MPQSLEDGDGRINILSVGRLGKEKNQKTIIKAIAASKYKNKISLHLAGQGYMQNSLMNLADELGVTMSIGYYDQKALAALMRTCPLTVHASVADIEAISVIEVFASGSVPIIAKSKKSAPSAFAISSHSLFPAKDVESLTRAIEWWIEHPSVIEPTRELYIRQAKELSVDASAKKFSEMCKEAIVDDLLAYSHERRTSPEMLRTRAVLQN